MSLERFIGRYRVDRRLGEGGMGTVYLAHDERIDRFVAIKMMRSDSEESLRRFKIEAKAAGRLKHPNIVTIYDFDIFDGNPCLIMEYVEGETIARLIARNEPLSIARKLELIEHVCRALAFAHRAGIVHRDIKPHNLMIERDGTVKVLDFGIARTTAGAGTTGKIVGTVAYMSPEQALGRSIDSRSDIWAIGLVLYEFVTGRVAFAGDSDYSVLDRIVRGEPEPFQHEDRDVVAQLEPILTKALAKDPADRYQNAEVMARDLFETRQQLANLSETPTIVIRRPAARPPIAPDPIEVAKATPAPKPPVVEAGPPRSAPRPEVPPQSAAPAASTVNTPQRSMVWAAVLVTAAVALAAGFWSVWPQPPVSITPAEPAPSRAGEPAPNPTPPLAAPAPPSTPAPDPSASVAAPDVKKTAPPEARKVAEPGPTGAGADRPVDLPPPPRPSVDYSARVAAARDAFENGDYAIALQRYEAVLRDDPGNSDATGGVQAVTAAQAAEQKVLGSRSSSATLQKDVNTRLTQARSRFEEGDYDGAISAYEEVLKLDSRNATALSGIAAARKAKAAEDAILKRPAKKPGV